MAAPRRQVVSEQHIQTLVNVLEHFNLIWDHRLKEYHDKKKKDAAWEALSKAVGLNTKDVRRTYETLRNQFRREHYQRTEIPLTNSLNGSGAPEVSTKKVICKYYENLLFLLPLLKPRKAQHNLSSCKVVENEKRSPDVLFANDTSSQDSISSVEEDEELKDPVAYHLATDKLDQKRAIPPETPRATQARETVMDIAENMDTALSESVEFWGKMTVLDLRQIRNDLTRRELMLGMSQRIFEAIRTEREQDSDHAVSLDF